MYSCEQVIASPIALLGSSIGAGELLLIFLVAIVLFGPKRLPEIARMLGRVVNELQRAARDFENQITHLDEEPGASEAERRSKSDSPAPSSPGGTTEKKQIPSDAGGEGNSNSAGKSNHDQLAG
jgi:Tat protein translocase TatB subunit